MFGIVRPVSGGSMGQGNSCILPFALEPLCLGCAQFLRGSPRGLATCFRFAALVVFAAPGVDPALFLFPLFVGQPGGFASFALEARSFGGGLLLVVAAFGFGCHSFPL